MNNEDLSAKVLEDFLSFLYTGEVSIESNFDQGNAQKVCNLALKYESVELKNFAFREISKKVPDKKLPDGLMDEPESLKESILSIDVTFFSRTSLSRSKQVTKIKSSDKAHVKLFKVF